MWNNEVWGTRKPVELRHTSPKRWVLAHFYGSKERFCTPFMKQIAEIDWLACIAYISLGLGSNDQQWDFLCFAWGASSRNKEIFMNPSDQCRLWNCNFKIKFCTFKNLFNPSKRRNCKDKVLAPISKSGNTWLVFNWHWNPCDHKIRNLGSMYIDTGKRGSKHLRRKILVASNR